MRARPYIAALLLFGAGAARADGISGYVEEEYSHSNDRSTDDAGNTRRSVSNGFSQRYRLTLERGFFPLLRFSGSGLFEQQNAWTSDGALPGATRDRTLGGFASLAMGGPVLGSTAAYNYRSEQTLASPDRLILEEPSLALSWRPADLPTFGVRLARTHAYDVQRQIEDLATLQALFNLSWTPIRELQLQYAASYTNPDDRLHQTDFVTVAQTLRADYQRLLREGKASVAAGINVSDTLSRVTSAGAGGTQATQQAPLAGFSLVETFPSTAALDTLTGTPALIDGNTAASAGLDLGFSLSVAGDTNPRDLGAQFADVLTQVNTVYVWVDRQLTPLVAGAFQWTAWQSDDNQRWTQVPIVAPVAFGVFQNRFEITIAQTAARYLKVVTRPLEPAVTIDKRFSSIFVTELQLLLVTPVTTSSGWQGNSKSAVNLNARTELFTPALSYDLSAVVTHATASGAGAATTWLLSNGLSYARKLTPILSLTARLARLDQDQSRGHESSFVYSSALAAMPAPALNHSFIYSGQSSWTSAGFSNSNAFSLYNRVTPYRGIGLLAGAAYNLTYSPDGILGRGATVTVNGSVQPHPKFSLSGTFGHTESISGSRPKSTVDRFDAGATFTPVPALYVSGGVSRVITTGVPRTLANGTASFSPFPGGDLQLSASYSETYQDPNVISRFFTPSLRWNVRAGTLVTVSYTLLDSSAGVAGTHSRTLAVNFLTTL